MESRHSLIGLQIEGPGGILDEVSLPKPDMEPSTGECHRPMQIPVLTQTNTLPCIESNTMDFEFTNTDLVNGTEYSIDNASMFGIAEPGFEDERSDCYDLFMESNCFGAAAYSKPNEQLLAGSMPSSIQSVSNVPVAVKDSDLMLQIIPLNNLQYVSTIQTDKGLHILAVPAGTIVNQVPPSNVTGLPGAVKLCSATTLSNEKQIEDTSSSSNICLTLDRHPSTTVEMANTYNMATSMENKNMSVTESTLKPVQNAAVVKTVTHTDKSTIDKKYNMNNKHARKKMVSLLNNNKRFRTSKGGNNYMVHSSEKPSGCIKLTIPVFQSDKKPVAKSSKKCNIKTPNNIQNQMKSVTKSVHVTKEDSLLVASRLETLTRTNTETLEERTKNVTTCNIETLVTVTDYQSKSDDIEVRSENVRKSSNTNENLDMHDKRVSVCFEKCKSSNCTTKGEKQEDTLDKPSCENKHSNSGFFTKSPVSKLYTCVHCSARFLKNGNLQNHYKLHKQLNNLVVSQKEASTTVTNTTDTACGSGSMSLSHARSEGHQVECGKWLTCLQCDQTFTTPGNFTRHLLSHTGAIQGSARYTCGQCDKGFQQKCDLKRHELTHTGQYPYKCDICNKGFVRKSDLIVHSRFHVGKKSHICTVCNKSYFQQGDLSRHIRQSHGESCKFPCPHCQMKYTTSKTLAQHVKHKHPTTSLNDKEDSRSLPVL